MKIDYTNFLRDKPQETDTAKLTEMKASLVRALQKKGVHGHISCIYYADGRIRVAVGGAYYGIFDTNTGKFFSGFVGD